MSKSNKSSLPKETVLQIKFANEAAAHHFASWLCGAGEQDYWQWMECREQDEDGDITAVDFDYHNTKKVDGSKKYGEFMEDNIIRTTAGRLDEGK
jgi:hypothetical protein